MCQWSKFSMAKLNNDYLSSECLPARFGPDCKEICPYCEKNECDSFGRCKIGCRSPEFCSTG